MYYIYGFQNKINGKWYIGQTIQNPANRKRQHINSSFDESDKDYNALFHQKIREYGIDNFSFEVLETVSDISLLDEKEKYWIAYYKSFVRDGNGYNLTRGGQQRKEAENYIDLRSAFKTEEEINQVIDQILNTDIKLTDLAKQYNVSLALICSINSGKKYHKDDKNYPLRPLKTKINDETVMLIIELLQSNWTNIDIANMLNIDTDIIYRINYGKAHKLQNQTYPIRKELSEKEIRANKIKDLLKENKLNNKQIADIVKCDPSTVSNINYGKSYFDSNLTYPIRKS